MERKGVGRSDLYDHVAWVKDVSEIAFVASPSACRPFAGAPIRPFAPDSSPGRQKRK
jgi:hypothetical protein